MLSKLYAKYIFAIHCLWTTSEEILWAPYASNRERKIWLYTVVTLVGASCLQIEKKLTNDGPQYNVVFIKAEEMKKPVF